MQSLTPSFPQNVIKSSGEIPGESGDRLYLERFFSALKDGMGGGFDDWKFVIHHRVQGERAGASIPMPPGGPKSALFLMCDERARFPLDQAPGFRWIFRSYAPSIGREGNILPFPIGYQNSVGLADPVSFRERGISVFFSGNLNRNRVDLYRQFRFLPLLPARNLRTRQVMEATRRYIDARVPERDFSHLYPGSIISFTNGFMKGLPQAEYAKTLANTRIAICPQGFVNPETIRHWEAMSMGCVIVTAPLPNNRYYRGSPMVVLQNWSELRAVLDSLLDDPAELQQRHEATMEWWRLMCGPEAVARHIANILQR